MGRPELHGRARGARAPLALALVLCASCPDGAEPTPGATTSPTPAPPAAGAQREAALAAYRSGQELMRKSDPNGAAEALRRAVALDPTLAEAQHLLGKILLHLSDVVFGTPTRDLKVLDEAIAAFRTAAELVPTNAEYAYWTGAALAKRGAHDEARTFLARAIALDPGHGHAHQELGLLEADAGETALACASLERATRFLPDEAMVWFQYGTQLEIEEDLEGARRAYAQAIAVDPTLPGPYSKLAVVLRRLGDTAGAEQAARDYTTWGEFGKKFKERLQAAKAAPRDAAAQLAVARVYLEADRYEYAVLWLRKTLDLEAGHAEALEALRAILAAHPDCAAARELLERAGAPR